MRNNAFEPSRLLQLFDGDPQAIREILEEAVVAIHDLVVQASAELTAGDQRNSAALIHELKGVAANVGAGELSVLSGGILDRLERSKKLQSERAVEDLTAALHRFTSEARAFLT